MPKMKTRRSVVAKFKVTGTGKLIKNQPGRRHKLTLKSSKRKRQLRKDSVLSHSFAKNYKKLIGC